MVGRREATALSQLEILHQNLAEGIHAARTLRDAIDAFSVEAMLVLKDCPLDEGFYDADRLEAASACDEATTEVLLIASRGA